MPVPVPARSPAHPVNKVLPPHAPPPGLVKQSSLRHLLNSLPEPPSGPPPAFTDRETWIKSLPPFRRYKVRQDVATPPSESSPVTAIETHRAVTKPRSSSISMLSPNAVTKDRIAVVSSSGVLPAPLVRVVHAPLSNGKPWPPSPPKAIKQAIKADERRRAVLGDTALTCDSGRDADDELSEEWTEDEAFFAGPPVYRQTSIKKAVVLEDNEAISNMAASSNFSQVSRPVVESDSDVDLPMAPFDGTLAVAASMHHVSEHKLSASQPSSDLQANGIRQAPIEQRDESDAARVRKTLTPISTAVTSSDMAAYKKRIAEPMSEWVAEYIWKVVTHGMSLPPQFLANETGDGKPTRAYASQPPTYLAENIRTLLCSTLLQPSAIFLALWYIARLPVFFGAFAYDAKNQSKEFKFRLELLGEGSTDVGAEKTRQLLEAHAPFRLLLLGVMLANKWLDDNTFSNKTWHQVSGIPMRALNRLESLGLDILSHDLSMLPRAWEQWLEHVQNYHRSLAPYPEPIGPPKDTPHVVIRRTIEELIAAGSPPITTGVLPEPVFLGLEERKKEQERRLAKEELDLLSLDLDEDGPLREEYLPKWHRELTSTNKDKRLLERALPPPAEWSPAADPPIHRARPIYQAVQRPPPAPILAHAQAHVTGPVRVQQANGYFNRTEVTFPDVAAHVQVQLPSHPHNQGWPLTEDFGYGIQTERLAFPQHGLPNYVPTSNVQYSAMVHHPGSWSVPVPYVALQPPAPSGYQRSGAFDAPPPSELFRPTWLRT